MCAILRISRLYIIYIYILGHRRQVNNVCLFQNLTTLLTNHAKYAHAHTYTHTQPLLFTSCALYCIHTYIHIQVYTALDELKRKLYQIAYANTHTHTHTHTHARARKHHSSRVVIYTAYKVLYTAYIYIYIYINIYKYIYIYIYIYIRKMHTH